MCEDGTVDIFCWAEMFELVGMQREIGERNYAGRFDALVALVSQGNLALCFSWLGVTENITPSSEGEGCRECFQTK